MNRRRIGIGWTLALLALLGHVGGADCCLIRGAVRDALAHANSGPAAAAHACCTTGAVPATAPAGSGAPDDVAPLPECCGISCAPVAALEAPVALAVPAASPAALIPVVTITPAAPAPAVAVLADEGTGPRPEALPRASRGRAPPIA